MKICFAAQSSGVCSRSSAGPHVLLTRQLVNGHRLSPKPLTILVILRYTPLTQATGRETSNLKGEKDPGDFQLHRVGFESLSFSFLLAPLGLIKSTVASTPRQHCRKAGRGEPCPLFWGFLASLEGRAEDCQFSRPQASQYPWIRECHQQIVFKKNS